MLYHGYYANIFQENTEKQQTTDDPDHPKSLLYVSARILYSVKNKFK